jgi:hypothetical protein
VSAAIHKIIAQFQEDGSAYVFARVAAYDGTGAATGIDGEGKWIKQADLASISCDVFNITPGYATPTTAVASPTVTISSAIQDTPVTSRENWTIDDIGWNFFFHLAPTNFATPGKYVAEFYFTTTGSAKWWLQVEGDAPGRIAG